MQIPRGERARIVDVAARAGVAVSTASKALNGRGQLRAETRHRVLAAADELGFQANTFARSLLSDRSYSVGLLTSDRVGRFSVPVLAGVEDALGVGKILVHLCDARGDPLREQHYVRTLLTRRTDGIIVTAERTDPRLPITVERPVPVVYAYAQSTRSQDVSVVPDDHQGATLVTRHLVESGRRRIGHITGDWWHAIHERAAGVRTVLAEAGLELAGGEAIGGDWSEAWGRQATEILLRRDPHIDAVVCGTDEIARGVLDTLRDHGRRVPHDVAVAGFDNWEPLVTGCRVPLTSVDLGLPEIGRHAAELLLAAMEGRAEPGVRKLPCRLVVRESTGAAAT
ncbi:LacI family DNA-binding transcriptional regulator [Pseudonocardia sp. MH-G8]|uniref:LacI family DNA-binding transcriptional regulator n=1 Tax=Pseudonocardia sp. MH-G8 TaxID=1854588 RepID=UPI000B9FBACF|nr:LacI family DNA-binding transcriptional regulator [Pseudonocardia sp. MH-G8]OZM78762.1 LacI family transcriptional regulator [Pseudonocardia sp. MH-G8]